MINKTTIRIIANKKISLTDTEWQAYQDLLASYDPKMSPKTFFNEMFETDREGIIIFLKTPQNQHFTLNVWLFIVNIFMHQQMREMYKMVNHAIEEMKENKDEKN